MKQLATLDSAKVAIVGLGYVGLPLAVAFGMTRKTIGFDVNPARIAELKKGTDSTLEVTSEDLSQATGLSFSSSIDDLKDCQIFIITVPTPIDSANRPNLKPLKRASESVASILKQGDIIIYESTVYPGCTEEVCVPVLESVSGLRYNSDFYCGYSPERINPGDKVNTLTTIVKVTSGSTQDVALFVDQLYGSIIAAGTFCASSIKVAEAAKVIENTQRDLNIALVNELSVIFDRLDIDTLDVLEAAGSKWNFLPFRPGMVGGHCIGVDPYYLTHKAEMVGYNPQVILAGRRINDNMARYAGKCVVKKMVQNNIDVSTARIGVLGITFKENCPDIRNSKVVDLVVELKSWGVDVVVHDPWADALEVETQYGLNLVAFDALQKLDSLVVAVGHKQFRALCATDLKAMTRGAHPVLGDIKAIFSRTALLDIGFTLFRF